MGEFLFFTTKSVCIHFKDNSQMNDFYHPFVNNFYHLNINALELIFNTLYSEAYAQPQPCWSLQNVV